jgi:hypothetical protein
MPVQSCQFKTNISLVSGRNTSLPKIPGEIRGFDEEDSDDSDDDEAAELSRWSCEAGRADRGWGI